LSVAGGSGEVDRHTGNTRFTSILFAVAIEVVPDKIAE